MALTARQVSCEREERILFEDISLAVNPGEILQISGKNGAGKTSLLKILAGLLIPSSGNIAWNGISIADCRSHFHQQLCYIGHNHAVNGQLSASENLIFATKAYTIKTTILRALQQLGTASYATVQAAQLSAGQRRRIALAKLCLLATKLWLLDEPYTSLDSQGVSIINELIADHLAAEGMVIITSHQTINIPNISPIQLVLS